MTSVLPGTAQPLNESMKANRRQGVPQDAVRELALAAATRTGNLGGGRLSLSLDRPHRMKTQTPWLYGLAVVVVLNIVASVFNSPAICMFRLPLMLAAYVIGIVLFFKLGVWPALALWWGIGLVTGLLCWSYEFRRNWVQVLSFGQLALERP